MEISPGFRDQSCPTHHHGTMHPIARGDSHYATKFQFFPSWCSPVTKSHQNAPPEEQTPLCGIILSQNRLPSAPWWQASAGAK